MPGISPIIPILAKPKMTRTMGTWCNTKNNDDLTNTRAEEEWKGGCFNILRRLYLLSP